MQRYLRFHATSAGARHPLPPEGRSGHKTGTGFQGYARKNRAQFGHTELVPEGYLGVCALSGAGKGKRPKALQNKGFERFYLGRHTGIEPVTPGITIQCSTD